MSSSYSLDIALHWLLIIVDLLLSLNRDSFTETYSNHFQFASNLMKDNVDREGINIISLLPEDSIQIADSNTKSSGNVGVAPMRQLEAVVEELEVHKLLCNFVSSRLRMMNSQTILQSMNNIGKSFY